MSSRACFLRENRTSALMAAKCKPIVQQRQLYCQLRVFLSTNLCGLLPRPRVASVQLHWMMQHQARGAAPIVVNRDMATAKVPVRALGSKRLPPCRRLPLHCTFAMRSATQLPLSIFCAVWRLATPIKFTGPCSNCTASLCTIHAAGFPRPCCGATAAPE